VNKMLIIIAESHTGPLQIYASSGECGVRKVADCFRSPGHLAEFYFVLGRITISSGQFIAAHRTKKRLFRSWEVQAYGCNVPLGT
jgi:hypothetical protein